MSKIYPTLDACTNITFNGITYNTTLAQDHITCERCDLREVCEDSQYDALPLFCAIYVGDNQYFKKVK